MGKFRILAVALLAAAALSACSDEPTSPATPEPEAPSAAQLDGIFEAAALEFGVPSSLLKSIGYVETRWEMVRGGVEFPGQEAAFGIMALRGERLAEGARMAKVTVEEARSEPRANIRAAAALLDLWADEMGIARGDLAAWGPVVARYSGIAQVEGQASYVHNDVYATLNRGVVGKTLAGEVAASIMPVRVRAAFQLPETPSLAVAPDYPVSGTVWRPSPNYNARPTGSTGGVQMVIIHTCEGNYSGCWSWLTNTAAGASAHYVVNESGSEISQLVRESNRAWHIAATYNCSLNSSVKCGLNGVSSNHFTVGIEHGGFASQSSFPVGQIDASARLSCDISKAHGVPRDRYHYVAHGQLQPYNRTDPGPNWPWTDYINRINSHCGSTGGGTSIVVDNNNANNNAASARFESSTTWQATSSTAGYYGSNYAFASTQPISDGATFWFYLPAAGTRTIDAWWTAGTNRSATAPFIAYNASGTEVGRASVNQQVNGGAFRTIGTWSFSAGWNRVVLSRWTTEGYVVIADAVRVR